MYGCDAALRQITLTTRYQLPLLPPPTPSPPILLFSPLIQAHFPSVVPGCARSAKRKPLWVTGAGFYGPDAFLVIQTTVSAKTNVTHATLPRKHGTTILSLFTDRRYTSTFQQASQLPFIVTTLSEAGFESASSFFGSICSQQCIT